MITGAWNDGVWVQEFNTDTGKYTERDRAGKVLRTRDLTADEVAALADMDADSQALDVLRIAAAGTGTFASATVRDAAIRALARIAVRGR